MSRSKKVQQGEGWALVARCPACDREREACRCGEAASPVRPPGRQHPRFRLEKRRGKPVTVVTHLVLPELELKDLAGRLKRRLGTGGTVSEGEIELQGDHRETLPGILRELGLS